MERLSFSLKEIAMPLQLESPLVTVEEEKVEALKNEKTSLKLPYNIYSVPYWYYKKRLGIYMLNKRRPKKKNRN